MRHSASIRHSCACACVYQVTLYSRSLCTHTLLRRGRSSTLSSPVVSCQPPLPTSAQVHHRRAHVLYTPPSPDDEHLSVGSLFRFYNYRSVLCTLCTLPYVDVVFWRIWIVSFSCYRLSCGSRNVRTKTTICCQHLQYLPSNCLLFS